MQLHGISIVHKVSRVLRGKKWGENTNLHVDARDAEVEASTDVRRVELKSTIVVL